MVNVLFTLIYFYNCMATYIYIYIYMNIYVVLKREKRKKTHIFILVNFKVDVLENLRD